MTPEEQAALALAKIEEVRGDTSAIQAVLSALFREAREDALERAAQIVEHPQPFDFNDAHGRRFFGEVPGSKPHAEAIRALKSRPSRQPD